MSNDFVECDTCRVKPGTPPLCHGCLSNRSLIVDLKDKLDRALKTQKARKPSEPSEGESLLLQHLKLMIKTFEAEAMRLAALPDVNANEQAWREVAVTMTKASVENLKSLVRGGWPV